MSDLDQVVDFRAASDSGLSDAGAIDASVCLDLHVVFNDCRPGLHNLVPAALIVLGESETAEAVKGDLTQAPVSEKMKALLTIAAAVQVSGKNVTQEMIKTAKSNGATDKEIHDTVLIAALFCLYNRYVDGLATVTPTDPKFYEGLGERITHHGYNRLAQGYEHLKQKA